MKSLFIGIDWADEDHDVCFTSEVGKCLDVFAIDDSILGLHKFNLRSFVNFPRKG